MLVEQLQHAEARIGRAGRPIHHRDARELRRIADRSEEHTSELQSPMDLVWRLLLEKKGTKAVGSSGHYSDFVVEALNGAIGDFPFVPILNQYQGLLGSHHPPHLLHRL